MCSNPEVNVAYRQLANVASRQDMRVETQQLKSKAASGMYLWSKRSMNLEACLLQVTALGGAEAKVESKREARAVQSQEVNVAEQLAVNVAS